MDEGSLGSVDSATYARKRTIQSIILMVVNDQSILYIYTHTMPGGRIQDVEIHCTRYQILLFFLILYDPTFLG